MNVLDRLVAWTRENVPTEHQHIGATEADKEKILPADPPCMFCGEPVRYVDGPPYHHDGCAGWPFCSCPERHTGDCQPPVVTVPFRGTVTFALPERAATNGVVPLTIEPPEDK